MFSWKDFKNKNWLQWIKILVALDIAAVGIALILGFNAHILAFIFGMVSRIFFGALYLFVAYIIFKQVFPDGLNSQEQREVSSLDTDILNTLATLKAKGREFFRSTRTFADDAYEEIDDMLEQGGHYLENKVAHIEKKLRKK